MNHETLRRASILSTIAGAALLLAATAPSLAQGNSRHAGNSGHMSAQGMSNGNGLSSADRDFGRDRAADRMSDQGLAHNGAGIRAYTSTRTITRNDRLNSHGANRAGFCPPGQAKKSGNGSHFDC
jgi:hypothetical protein